MKKAVQFGAGNIGRGFLGQLFSGAGYEVVFVDVDRKLIGALNDRRSYTLEIAGTGAKHVIGNVRAVFAGDAEAVSREVCDASIMATAVGVGVLEKIAPLLAAGIKARMERGPAGPLNIVICENLLDAGNILRGYVKSRLPEIHHAGLDGSFGFVESVVSRMIPVVPEEIRTNDPSYVMAEEYCILPVAAKDFIGPVPAIPGMAPYADLKPYEERKLYIHNLGHAACAYHGALKGLNYIWEAIGDPGIRLRVKAAMEESGAALVREHGFTESEIREHVEDLVSRFANRALGDTVGRVGRDCIRKLGPSDRFIGACRLCLKHGITPAAIARGAAACMMYARADDAQSVKLQGLLATDGPAGVLSGICGLEPGDPAAALIEREYRRMNESRGL